LLKQGFKLPLVEPDPGAARAYIERDIPKGGGFNQRLGRTFGTIDHIIRANLLLKFQTRAGRAKKPAAVIF
jgi:hypothetical protein